MEKAAIADSTKGEPIAGKDGRGNRDLSFAGLSGEKIFLLDEKEATRPSYGYSDTEGNAQNRIKAGSGSDLRWWLRSPHATINTNAGMVDADGCPGHNNVKMELGVSPAFNVNLSSVIFTSLIPSNHSDDFMAGKDGAEYKLTILDKDLNIKFGDVKITVEYELSIPYEITDNSNTSDPNQVSIVVTTDQRTDGKWRKGSVIRQYYKEDVGENVSSGTVTFALDDSITGKWGEGFNVYIMAEDINGEYE